MYVRYIHRSIYLYRIVLLYLVLLGRTPMVYGSEPGGLDIYTVRQESWVEEDELFRELDR